MDFLLEIVSYIATGYCFLQLVAVMIILVIYFSEPKPSKDEIDRLTWKGKW